MLNRTVAIDDKYALDKASIYVTGVQCLVRLPMMQRALDRAAGLNTAGFISGYRGSPLGVYDTALNSAKKFLKSHDIVFHAGVNEDLAATSVWGTQQTTLFGQAKVDGVFGIWYGKGPGVDRSMDVIKHGNLAGSAKHGGVVVLLGDDHGAYSSTSAHQSEQVMEAAMIPILNPSDIREYIDFGLYGFALSRYSGCWSAFKVLTETIDSSASLEVKPPRVFVTPTDFTMPPDGLNIRIPDTSLAQERRLHGPKMEAVAAFARANPIDEIVVDPRPARLGIATTGKAYVDLRQALDMLGLDLRDLARLGVRLYKIGLAWPLERSMLSRFAEGLDEVLVVEEKRGFIENQIALALFNVAADIRPRLVGKLDENGTPLFPSFGEVSPAMIARVVAARLLALDPNDVELRNRLAALEKQAEEVKAIAPVTARSMFFCSGCPHNTSTKVPDGSRAAGGIGCHYMAAFIPARNTSLPTQMGGEGANWIGQAPFTDEKHIFQNIGDGTYYHSGLMAIRAAVAGNVNITYKVLYNDAVAMTGGQGVDGPLTVQEVSRQLAAEGLKRIIVVSDDIEKYGDRKGFAETCEFRHRDELDLAQRELRDTPGVTGLIYDQTCAAEKRRRRKRGLMDDPDQRVFINERVCEGCGDCSVQSNCISVQPLETELGRKREINQSACNKDFSCLKGFCPSFVTVHGATMKKPGSSASLDALLAAIPPAVAPKALNRPYGILITGIGGTGIVTVGAILGMAAHLEGKGATVLDLMGMAQKNGAVMTHLRISASEQDLHSVRLVPEDADLALGCDMIVAASPTALATYNKGRTHAVVNATVAPTMDFVLDRNANLKPKEMTDAIASRTTSSDFVAATDYAQALTGDAIGANLFLLGFAYQKGSVPLSAEAIETAIELNGVGVKSNKRAFALGRLAAHDPKAIEDAAKPALRPRPTAPRNIDELIERRVAFLTDYQNTAYAQRYADFVAEVRKAERAVLPGQEKLATAVANNLFRLMAYKDEYEVARLYSDGEFMEALKRQFDGDISFEFHLAPPILTKLDPATGRPKKRKFRRWMMHGFKALAALRGLRGTAFDIFGTTAERKMERRLIEEYRARIFSLLPRLEAANYDTVVAIANVPDDIRGYGPVKDEAVAKAEARVASLMAALDGVAKKAA